MNKKKKSQKKAKSFKNLVAKHAAEFNRSVVHRDRTKYKRKRKHKNADPD